MSTLLAPIANLALLPLMALLSLLIGWAASGRGRDLPPLVGLAALCALGSRILGWRVGLDAIVEGYVEAWT